MAYHAQHRNKDSSVVSIKAKLPRWSDVLPPLLGTNVRSTSSNPSTLFTLSIMAYKIFIHDLKAEVFKPEVFHGSNSEFHIHHPNCNYVLYNPSLQGKDKIRYFELRRSSRSPDNFYWFQVAQENIPPEVRAFALLIQ